MKFKDFIKKTCAGIVTYNPEIERFKMVICSIINQVDKVFVFDNGSSNIDDIISTISECGGVLLIRESENKGIAQALNAICELAIMDNYEWVLTLDHDTICDPNMIRSYQELAEIKDVGIICPRVRYINYNTREKGNTSNRYSEVTACMTSGSFMRLTAFKETVGFDNWMFIDYVDNDICTKLKLAGYRIIRDNNVFISHQLGHAVERKIFGIKTVDFQYSKQRIYYIVRNSIYYRRKYKYEINRFKYDAIIAKRILMYFLLYYKEKGKTSAIIKGISDGLSKRL